MAGVAGFEPTNAGVKVPCLTAWRHPTEGYIRKTFLQLYEEKRVDDGDSNPRMPEPQSGVLATSPHPPHLCQEGLEPPTLGLEGRCSIQLSYWHTLERVMGIEPT